MKLLRNSALVALILAVTGCASGPPFNEVSSSFAPLAPGKARVFFYRTSTLGAAIKPKVHLNEEVVGTAVAGGFFFVDRDPGSYTVKTTTEVERALTLSLAAGETRYVRLNVSMGLFAGHIAPELVDNATGAREIVKTKAIESK